MSQEIAQRLRAARAAMHPTITQRDVAKRLGKSPSAINLWEAGKNEPGLTELGELAKWYSVTADWLIGIDNTPAKVQQQRAEAAAKVDGAPMYSVPVVSAASLTRWAWDVVHEKLQTTVPYPPGTAAALLASSDAISSTCPTGAYAVISNAHQAQPGQYVLAALGGSSEPVLRRFVREGSELLLMADDTRWPTYRVDGGAKIIGKVVEVVVRRTLN